MMIGLIAWYGFCAVLIMSIMYMFRALNRPAFRSDEGDITTEVGYEEDPTGQLIKPGFGQASSTGQEDPHVMHVGDARSCMM